MLFSAQHCPTRCASTSSIAMLPRSSRSHVRPLTNGASRRSQRRASFSMQQPTTASFRRGRHARAAPQRAARLAVGRRLAGRPHAEGTTDSPTIRGRITRDRTKDPSLPTAVPTTSVRDRGLAPATATTGQGTRSRRSRLAGPGLDLRFKYRHTDGATEREPSFRGYPGQGRYGVAAPARPPPRLRHLPDRPGVDPRTVMEILGNSTFRLTMDTFAHVLDEQLDEAAEAMDRAWRQL